MPAAGAFHPGLLLKGEGDLLPFLPITDLHAVLLTEGEQEPLGIAPVRRVGQPAPDLSARRIPRQIKRPAVRDGVAELLCFRSVMGHQQLRQIDLLRLLQRHGLLRRLQSQSVVLLSCAPGNPPRSEPWSLLRPTFPV